MWPHTYLRGKSKSSKHAWHYSLIQWFGLGQWSALNISMGIRMDLILVTLAASKTTGKGNHDVLLCSPQNVKKRTFENSVFDPGTSTYAPAPSRLTGEVLYLRVTFLNRRSRMRHFRPCQPFTADNMRQRRSLSLVLLSQVSRNYKRLPDSLDTTGWPEELSRIAVSSIYSDPRQLFWSPCIKRSNEPTT